MNFKEHNRIAQLMSIPNALFLGFATTVDAGLALASILPFVLGSSFPDLDTESIPSKRFASVALGVLVVCLFTGMWYGVAEFLIIGNIVGIIFLLFKKLEHRGITHKYWIPIILVVFAFSGLMKSDFIPVICFSYGMGIVCHLIVDKIWPWDVNAAWNVWEKAL